MRRNVAFGSIIACLIAAFALGFAASVVVGETWGAVLFYVSLILAAITVIAIGLGSSRAFAVMAGFFVGLLSPIVYYEGRWVAFSTGWNGLEMRKFLSSLGEMDVTAAEAQGLVLIFGGLFGIVSGLAGAALGWMASRGNRRSAPV